ncbi:hypothetical protein Q31b_15050 [Novipirellula aureliae]|uniref:Uncharacterized protein n=2 Tax=Novipirellula aureliae TaxID=2527966 RepID=A0A5C6E8G3_9BACT|nr:hypothetical protein Q31b_15050 [Novipirellula aureliae]
MLQSLTEQGIALTAEVTVKLDKPEIMDRSDPGQRDRIAQRYDWKRFTRDSVTAPISIDLDYLYDDSNKRIGHSIRFQFVIHESLERLRDRDWMSSVFTGRNDNDPKREANPSSDEAFVQLTTAQLLDRGIRMSPDVHFGFATVPLMNRVLLRGVVASQTTHADSSVISSWRLLDSIDSSDRYAARWSPLDRDSLGNQIEGNALPYRGAGGYILVQSLGSIDESLADACLVSVNIVLHEPPVWFGSSNFLRSKFPLVIQETVRKLRRKLD